MGLIGLTYIQSNENFTLHATSFATFLTCSNLFMLSALVVTQTVGGNTILKKLFLGHISSLILTMYCYWRHNAYCEDYIYTFFAIFEYVVVFTNIGFHHQFGRAFGGSIVSIQAHQAAYSQLLPS